MEDMINIPVCASPLPYPPICVQEQNHTYGQAMLENFAGCASELSAVTLYFYNHLITCQYEDLSAVFFKTSIVEMKHFKIFGALALHLGEDPRLWSRNNSQTCYWSASNLPYTFQLASLLCNAIHNEAETIKKYESQIKQIRDPYIIENLKRIILDEQIHVNLFQGLYAKYVS